jgi:prepilin-type N-terminal cleavage/methylation domain-containing protein
MQPKKIDETGFTLIELSIVLVIIGLIIGSVLVGQELVSAAYVRAQITQIQKYQAAVHAFQSKYSSWLPGDIPNPYATQFGLAPPGSELGQGDGNGIIQGNVGSGPSCCNEGGGETLGFWADLNIANLIEGQYSSSGAWVKSSMSMVNPISLSSYLPTAAIGQGNYVYVYDNATWASGWSETNVGGYNYFGVSQGAGNCVAAVGGGYTCTGGRFYSSPTGISVAQAYNIDKKIDDGMPESGSVLACSVGVPPNGAQAIYWSSGDNGPTDTTTAIAPSPTTCYDNKGNGANPKAYSMGQNAGVGMNCGLSFQFQ